MVTTGDHGSGLRGGIERANSLVAVQRHSAKAEVHAVGANDPSSGRVENVLSLFRHFTIVS